MSSYLTAGCQKVSETAAYYGNRAADFYEQRFVCYQRNFKLLRFGSNAFRWVIDRFKDADLFGPLRLLNFLELPSNVRGAYKSTAKFFKERSIPLTLNEKVDHVARVIGSVGEFFDNATTGIVGIGTLGVAAISQLSWLTPLFAFGVALEGVYVIHSGKVACESYAVLKKIKELTKKNPGELKTSLSGHARDKLQKMVDYLVKARLQEKSFISKHFNAKGSDFVDKMKAIGQAALKKGDESDLISQKVYKTVRSYLRHKIAQHVISAVALSVMLVGIAILVAGAPAAPIGFGLIFVGSLISLANRNYAAHMQDELNATLEEAQQKLGLVQLPAQPVIT